MSRDRNPDERHRRIRLLTAVELQINAPKLFPSRCQGKKTHSAGEALAQSLNKQVVLSIVVVVVSMAMHDIADDAGDVLSRFFDGVLFCGGFFFYHRPVCCVKNLIYFQRKKLFYFWTGLEEK